MKLSRILRLVSVIILPFITRHLNAAEINHVINISPDMVTEHEYLPLLEDGKSWWYNYRVDKNLIGADVHDRNLTFKLEGKKEIDGKEYHILNFYVDGVFDAIAAYLYEDIENKQIYVIRENHDPEIICEHWFAVWDGLLYDFNDPDMPILTYYSDNKIPAEIEVNGNTYYGWKYDDEFFSLAAVEGLGLIYSNDKKHYLNPTLLGFVDQIAGGTLNIYPYLYKITDKDGNVLYEIKENEFSSLQTSSIDNKISARTEGKTILIDNPFATQVTVTNGAGMQIYQSSDTNIRIEASPGLYMVIGDHNATKLIVK